MACSASLPMPAASVAAPAPAFAFASGGFQVASAGGGAEAVIINTATIIVAAEADIFVGNAAQKGASAVAVATALGWFQGAFAGTVTATGADRLHDRVHGRCACVRHDCGRWLRRDERHHDLYAERPSCCGAGNTGFDRHHCRRQRHWRRPGLGNSANAIGFTQVAAGSSALALFVNGPTTAATAGGTMVVAAHAFASGDNAATAIAFADGVNQKAVAARGFIGQPSIYSEPARSTSLGCGRPSLTALDSSANLVLVVTEHAGRTCGCCAREQRHHRCRCDRYGDRQRQPGSGGSDAGAALRARHC